MINLRDEIQAKKLNIECYHNEKYTDGFFDGIDECLEVLDKYNIIAAPKSIKLSEIINKLNSCDNRNNWNIIVDATKTLVLENSNFEQEYFYINDNKIFDLSDCMVHDDYKWLYALWITNTEIIDDIDRGDNNG